VFVDGRPEQPAFATDRSNGNGAAVLVKMINSVRGFPVDVVYATPIDSIDGLGTVSSHLPRPDMIVTHSRWDVFLPAGPRYHMPDSTMDVVLRGVRVNPRHAGGEIMARASDQAQMGQPLRITVPTQGIQFAFEKLYANQSPEQALFAIRYVSADANQLGLLLSVVGTVLLWIGVIGLASRRVRAPRLGTGAAIVAGVVLLAVTIGYLGTTPVLPSALALIIAAILAAWLGFERWRAWRGARSAAQLQ
jgi:hypothetical protein